MADVDIQRKGPRIWPIAFGLLALLLRLRTMIYLAANAIRRASHPA